jgi:hypothetical protein
MNKKIILILLLAAAAVMTGSAFATCQTDVPGWVSPGDCACFQLCVGQTPPAIPIESTVEGPDGVPNLQMVAGCATCGTSCTELEPPTSVILNGHPRGWYPGQYWGQSDHVTFLLWYDDSWPIWFLEIHTDADGCFSISDLQLSVNMRSGLEAVAGENEVRLSWATASETTNDRFVISRDGTEIGHVSTLGNGPTGHDYSWVDNTAAAGRTYTYELAAVDAAGHRQILGTTSASPTSAHATEVTEYALRQNYPNPFNPTTGIEFDLVAANHVSLKVFNMMGQEVATLVNREVPAGRHAVNFDGSRLPSGIYLYTIAVGDRFSATRKMLLVK